uniref:Uncharacterized protein n=1 Tax=Nymphaea colorata TaxID=210225 RepID=A0A5K0YCK9_9MAGN|nr:unnamed protein product [Nymphaea colorata]
MRIPTRRQYVRGTSTPNWVGCSKPH